MLSRLVPRGLLSRSIMAVVIASLVIGALLTVRTLLTASDRTRAQALTHLHELLDTVENTVSIACFVNDAALAAEVASGLLKNAEVDGVSIWAGSVRLVDVQRPGLRPGHRDSSPASRIERVLHSPFSTAHEIGTVELFLNEQEIERRIDGERRYLVELLTLYMLAVAATVMVVLLRLVVRPITQLSQRLHRLDVLAGERLRIPAGHDRTEIGGLAGDINRMADRLVSTLTEERRLLDEKAIDERKYLAIFDNAQTGIFIVDAESRVDSLNRAAVEMLDVPPEGAGALIGAALEELGWLQPWALMEMILDCIARNAVRRADLEFVRRDGGTRWLTVVLSPVSGQVVQGVMHDVTDRKRSEEMAILLAKTDVVTGLANRNGFDARVQALIREMHAEGGGDFSLLLIDIDGFRRVNDSLGMAAGDDVLREVARRLQACLAAGDLIGRLGGDEFAVALAGVTDAAAIERIAERIAQSLTDSFPIRNQHIHLGGSIGITIFPDDGEDPAALLRNAEMALDRAKAGSRGYCFFDATMIDAAERRLQLDNDLRMALRQDEFRLHYQPIVDIRSNRLVGAEALLRWQHPARGFVPPDSFIPLAEEMGLIDAIGRWALERVCEQLAAWRDGGHDYYVSLNVSGRQIPSGLPASALQDTLRRHGVGADRLVLEITEGVLLADMANARAWLDEVRACGIRVYLDDFGTGYSSLSYLKRLPVDTLKVDRSFVRDMTVDGNDRTLVGAIVAMAQGLGMKVVAEGVENEAQLDVLRSINCDAAQGYYFSRPVPPEQIEAIGRRF